MLTSKTGRRARSPGLDSELLTYKLQIEEVARSNGLDFFDVLFEVVDFEEMNMVAAYGGFPTRYPHWRFGMAYGELSKRYAYGLSKIFELVINNDPTYAYLLTSNTPVEQRLVMAHVLGHADFFKHNLWFSRTNRKAIDAMANHGTRVRRYIDEYGLDRVEKFVDRCLSLENLIDPHSPFIVRPTVGAESDPAIPGGLGRLRSKDYMEAFINPPDVIDREQKEALERQERVDTIPAQPTQDVLRFLIEHAPLKDWQRDILGIVREEAYYFAPQAMTKIMNEGWASFWHSRIMTRTRIACTADIVDFADVHSRTMATAPGGLNPYKLGLELFRDIEERWNKGRHGREWEMCDALEARRNWDTGAMAGLEKIFEVRQIYNDMRFIDTFLTADFCRRHKLFGFAYNAQSGDWEVETRKFDEIKTALVRQLTNLGAPIIKVQDANHGNRGELYLRHYHEGVDLKRDHAEVTLANLTALWGRPVLLETVEDEKAKVLRAGDDGIEEQVC